MDAYNRGDYATALREWRPLAEQGNVMAQSNLGLLYANGHGVLQGYAQAQQWWEKAAAQGDGRAMNNLGTNYLNGYGVPEDYKTALFWLRLAAGRGNATAQAKLGLMYKKGWGVPQDFIQAHKWYNLAGANGETLATVSRDQLAEGMTSENSGQIQSFRQKVKDATCCVGPGGVLMMRPLLLHTSSASTRTECHRRVIHLEFAGRQLPAGLRWL